MLVKLGKKLKKNNVAMDIVNFGEEDANTAKLQALIEAINSNENRYSIIMHFMTFTKSILATW